MATQGINTDVQRVKWRIVADSVQSGLVSDIWDQTSQVLTALEFPAGFDSTSLTFQGAHTIKAVVAGSDLTVDDPPNGRIIDSRYEEDPSNPFVTIVDEADMPIVVVPPAVLPRALGLDDNLPEISAFRYLRLVGNIAQAPESFVRVHSKEP